MPGIAHEALLDLARLEPGLPALLAARMCGVQVPAYQVATAYPNEVRVLTPLRPKRKNKKKPDEPHVYRSDQMFSFSAHGRPVCGLDYEVERNEVATRLRRVKVYAATLEDELGCDAVVLMQCPTRVQANYYRRQAANPGGSSLVLRLAVFASQDVPVITDLEQARQNPALAVHSLVSHAELGPVDAQLEAGVAAVKAADPKKRGKYDDIVRAVLPPETEARWRTLMTSTLGSEYLSDYYRGAEAKGRAEGEAKGRAESVLSVLEGRGIAVSAAQRKQILACTDLDKTREWVRRAVTAQTTADVIG